VIKVSVAIPFLNIEYKDIEDIVPCNAIGKATRRDRLYEE